MKKILVVVDMQNDFIDGPLGTPEARAIVDNVCAKIRGGEWDKIIFTRDTHDEDYLETQEGKHLPVKHCIRNSDGWTFNDKVYNAVRNIKYKNEGLSIYNKPSFGSLGLVNNTMRKRDSENIELTLIGVCTDICVISNALLLKAHYPEMKIVVDAACCAGTTPEKHRMALEVMKSCQVDVVNDSYAVRDINGNVICEFRQNADGLKLNKEEFEQKYCTSCGSQRCGGIETSWFNGCVYKDILED